MPENVGVSLEKLMSTSTAIRESNHNMSSHLEGVSEHVKNLKAVWQSEAANSLGSIVGKMDEKFRKLQTEVDGFAVLLDGIRQNYEKTEKKITDGMKPIENMYSQA